MKMDETIPDSFLESSTSSSVSPTTQHESGFKSTAQQYLNAARRKILASKALAATHDLRRRANNADGTLLSTQPDGTPRKAFDINKIPRPRARKDKEAAAYFLDRYRLMNMWNGRWAKDSDWEAWDKAKAKMERQFTNYRIIEQSPPPLKGWQVKGYRRRENKRKRKENPEADLPSEKRRCEGGGDNDDASEESTWRFPTPEDVLAVTPVEGIRMESLLEKFWKHKGWERQRFYDMLKEIGTVNRYTKMFIPSKKLDTSEASEKVYNGGHGDTDIPIDPLLLNMSSGNACIKAAKVEVY